MKNNIVAILLVVLIGILSGLGLLIGIHSAVALAINPVSEKLGQLTMIQRDMQVKLANPRNNDMAMLAARLAAIENKLNQIGAGNGPGPQQPPQPPTEDFNKQYTIPVGPTPLIGKKDAAVTIVEFTDLQCPFCARFYTPVKEILKQYPDQVNFMIKNFPLSFHPNARPAAKLALAAHEQGKYIETVELLLENGADVSEAKVKEYAQKAGLNYDKWMADVKAKDAQYEQQINADLQLGSQVDVRGTPTFFINGKKTMARDANGFKAAVDQLLAEKK